MLENFQRAKEWLPKHMICCRPLTHITIVLDEFSHSTSRFLLSFTLEGKWEPRETKRPRPPWRLPPRRKRNTPREAGRLRPPWPGNELVPRRFRECDNGTHETFNMPALGECARAMVRAGNMEATARLSEAHAHADFPFLNIFAALRRRFIVLNLSLALEGV